MAMRRMFRRRLLDLARREDGISLVMALLIMMVLTISTVGVVTFVDSNENSASRDRQTMRAFSAAEAGLDAGLQAIVQADPNNDPAHTALAGAHDIDTSTYSWSAVKTNGVWTITATGISPTGVKRVLQQQAAPNVQTIKNQSTVTTPASAAYGWGFFVNNPPGVCTSLVGNTTIHISVWVANNLCLNGNAYVQEPGAGHSTLNLYVGGQLTATGNFGVGTSTQHVAQATVHGGCRVNNKNVVCSTASASHIYADRYSSTTSTLTKPPVYPDQVYASANWRTPSCSVGSFVFDNDATRNSSVTTQDLFANPTKFDCTVSDSSGHQAGRLAWDPTVTPHVLTISGTIFIDASMWMAGNDAAVYRGSGTIYVNGSVSGSGNLALCGPPSTPAGAICNGTWDPQQGTLEIVSLGGWSLSGNAEMDVVAYVVGNYAATGNAYVTGPVITDTAALAGNAKFVPVLNPPPGAPGDDSTATVESDTTKINWLSKPGSWRECPAATGCPPLS
jgi:Tfp pilus assembly protein PilX